MAIWKALTTPGIGDLPTMVINHLDAKWDDPPSTRVIFDIYMTIIYIHIAISKNKNI